MRAGLALFGAPSGLSCPVVVLMSNASAGLSGMVRIALQVVCWYLAGLSQASLGLFRWRGHRIQQLSGQAPMNKHHLSLCLCHTVYVPLAKAGHWERSRVKERGNRLHLFMKEHEHCVAKRHAYRNKKLLWLFLHLIKIEEARWLCLLSAYSGYSINSYWIRAFGFSSLHLVEVKMFKIPFSQSLVLTVMPNTLSHLLPTLSSWKKPAKSRELSKTNCMTFIEATTGIDWELMLQCAVVNSQFYLYCCIHTQHCIK